MGFDSDTFSDGRAEITPRRQDQSRGAAVEDTPRRGQGRSRDHLSERVSESTMAPPSRREPAGFSPQRGAAAFNSRSEDRQRDRSREARHARHLRQGRAESALPSTVVVPGSVPAPATPLPEWIQRIAKPSAESCTELGTMKQEYHRLGNTTQRRIGIFKGIAEQYRDRADHDAVVRLFFFMGDVETGDPLYYFPEEFRVRMIARPSVQDIYRRRAGGMILPLDAIFNNLSI